MYWPIGAPRIHAASHTPRSIILDAAGNNKENNGLDHDSEESLKLNVTTEAAPDSKEAPDQRREAHVGGPILGVRLSRNGNLFVTITKGTLTIWQTKV
jgi:hypothetical protein